MELISGTFRHLLKNTLACFSGRKIFLFVAAIAATCYLILSGTDWLYFEHTKNIFFMEWVGAVAGVAGFLVPILLPVEMYRSGRRNKNFEAMRAAMCVAQAELVALIVSIIYKAVTGRAQPELYTAFPVDVSKNFHFGFLQNGVYWGWPSSHTIVATAMAAAIATLYPRHNIAKYGACLYAAFIGFGITFMGHWLSDVVAGALMGIGVGVAIGKAFVNSQKRAT
ncbi:MAG: phosphatase PAP2 family protein [Patescibacteria group bacterium]|nr:phosphatase PAP2 family protein [Patescibacteria group bacterium]